MGRTKVDFDLKDAVGLFNTQTAILNTLWTIYAAVAVGVIGLVLGKLVGNINTGLVQTIASIVFLIFSLSNLGAITRTQKILVDISDEIHEFIQESAGGQAPTAFFHRALNNLRVIPVKLVITFHLVLDVGVLLAIWLPHLMGTVQGGNC